ncbi:Uncharacterised protein [Bordetella pertussis]|nr:Uncharacterised protein [Bordetella pertussis]
MKRNCTPSALAFSASCRVKRRQSPVSSLGRRLRSSNSYGTPHSSSTAMSRRAASICAAVRNSCNVPWVRCSYWMPVSARKVRRQSRLYSARRSMRSLLTL